MMMTCTRCKQQIAEDFRTVLQGFTKRYTKGDTESEKVKKREREKTWEKKHENTYAQTFNRYNLSVATYM